MPEALDDHVQEAVVQAAVVAEPAHETQPLKVLMETHALPEYTASSHAFPLVTCDKVAQERMLYAATLMLAVDTVTRAHKASMRDPSTCMSMMTSLLASEVCHQHTWTVSVWQSHGRDIPELTLLREGPAKSGR